MPKDSAASLLRLCLIMTFPDVDRPCAHRPFARVGFIGVGFAGLVLSACSHSSAPSETHMGATEEAACPLSGVPAPTGGVPNRPAMAVKVDNYPTARPQSGLDKADIVFEQPVEGGITRYVAVFQCNDAFLIGPVRSARSIDIGIPVSWRIRSWRTWVGSTPSSATSSHLQSSTWTSAKADPW